MHATRTIARGRVAAAFIACLGAEAGAQEARDGEEGTVLDPILVDRHEGWDRNAGAADREDSIYVDREDVDRRNPQTLKELFAGESEVSVGGAQPASQKIYVNGVEETNLAVTVDGARQNQKLFHHSTTNLIDPQLLKAVRVDAGVAPADAGAGALAGSIVFETVDVDDLLAPGRSFGAFASGDFITNGTTVTSGGAIYGRAGGFEGLGFFRFGGGDDYSGGDGSVVRGTETDFQSYLLKAAWESGSGHRFELSGERVDDDADRPYRANIGELVGRPDPIVRKYDLSRANAAFTYETVRPMGLFDPKVTLAWTEATVDVPDPYGSEGAASGWNGKAENAFPLFGMGTLTAGVDFYDEETTYTDPWTPKIAESASNIGLYAQARIEPLEALRLSFGMRGDRQRFEGIDGSKFENSGLSGNVSAAYDIAEFMTVRGGWSNVFGGIVPQESYIFNPNWVYDDMDPVRSENFTAGIEGRHSGFTASAGLFRTDIQDARDANYSAGPFQAFNFRSQGYTLGLGYEWRSGFVRANFTDADVTSGGGAVDSDTLTYFGAPVGRTFAIEATQLFFDEQLRVGGTVEIALDNDDLVSQGLEEIEGYEVVNLYMEYRPVSVPQLALRLEANNIFDEAYADRATYGQEFGVVQPLLEPGRSVLLSARVQF